MEGFWGHVDGGVFNVVFVMIFLVDVGGDVVERYASMERPCVFIQKSVMFAGNEC